MRINILLSLALSTLVACDDGGKDTSSGDGDTGEDTGDTATDTADTADSGDTGDTGEPVPFDIVVPEHGACGDLRAPMELTTPESVWMAAGSVSPFAFTYLQAVQFFERIEPGICPTDFVNTDGNYTADFGEGCTTSTGWQFRGRLVATMSEAGATWNFDRFGMRILGEDNRLLFTVHGTAEVVNGADDMTVNEDVWWEFSSAGEYAIEGMMPGQKYHDVTYVTNPTAGTSTTSAYQHVYASGTGTATGDYCVTWTSASVDTCENEADGVVEVTAAQEATLTFDGSSNCDGCGDVVIDGTSAGEFCFAAPS